MSDMDALQSEINRVVGLINEGSELLEQPVSSLRADFEKDISKCIPRLAAEFSKITSKGRIEEIVIGGAIIGACWVGAGAIDLVRNAAAKSKARKVLVGYYQELAVKQGLLIEQQREITNELLDTKNLHEAKERELRKRLSYTEEIISRMIIAQQERTV